MVAPAPSFVNVFYLDIDVIRGQLGGWLDQPNEAGLAARAMALSMIDTHLSSRYDVVIPQLLARPDFIEQLERAAANAGAVFVEIALGVTRADAISAFAERRETPTHPTHQDASDLVDRSPSADPVAEMYDALQLLLETRPECHRIDAPRGDIGATLSSIRRTLSDDGINWYHVGVRSYLDRSDVPLASGSVEVEGGDYRAASAVSKRPTSPAIGWSLR